MRFYFIITFLIGFHFLKGVHEDYKEGIPLHRIRYFKINERIVWDREQKIDLLTGSGESVADFFDKKEEDTTSSDDETDQSLVNLSIDKNVFVDGQVFKFVDGEWIDSERTNRENQSPLDQFKLLTYNLMSNINFKKSILSKINFKKSLIEVQNRPISNEDEYGLKPLEGIDRMGVIMRSIRENGWDFLLLQECDQHEENRLREDEFVQRTYFICSLNRTKSKIEHPNCVILSKRRPTHFKLLKLTDGSNKYALLAKYTLGKEHLLLVNMHLSSNKAKNFNEKRKIQLETLKRYLVDQLDEFEMNAEHCLLCGDFNFGDAIENEIECGLLSELFEKNGFSDMVRNVYTYDPEKNFAAAVTAFNQQPRRLDRILYKSSSENVLELLTSQLVNTAPFKINDSLSSSVLYEPYLSIRSFTQRNLIEISEKYFYYIKYKNSLSIFILLL